MDFRPGTTYPGYGGAAGYLMDLKQLRYFAAVAELESFTAAAVRLNIAQSALSRQIANLEAEFGVPLFHRRGKRVSLAPAGIRLRNPVEKLLSDAENLKTVAWREQGDVAGTVRVGTDPSLGDGLFPRLMARLAKTHPNVVVDAIQGLNSELQEHLMRGLLDAAILSFPDALPGRDLELLAREPLYLVSAASQAPDLGDICKVDDVLRFPLIVAHRPHRERLRLERLAKSRGVELLVATEVDRLPLTISLARRGLGFAILPHTALTDYFDDAAWSITRIADFSLSRYLASRPSALPSPVFSVVEAALREEINQLRDEGAFLPETVAAD